MHPFMLVVWKEPRVRSGRAAERAIHSGEKTFEPSGDLAECRRRIAADDRISIDRELGWSADRILFLAIPWDAVDELGPWIAGICRDLGLILFDMQHGQLVVPRRQGAAPWLSPEPPNIQLLRQAVEGVPLTGDGAEDADRLNDAVRAAFSRAPATRDIREH